MKLLQVYANAICAQADLLATNTDIARDREHLKKMLRTLEEYTRKYKQELAVTNGDPNRATGAEENAQ